MTLRVMEKTGRWPGQPSFAWHARQRGQAVILVVATAVIVLLAALLVYNAGQLNLKKTKLQNTADSAAYSGALLLSRAYNFTAYSNRAMVANQVAIAQLVSLSSWSRYYCTTFTATDCGKFTTLGTDDEMVVLLDLFDINEPANTANKTYQKISKGIWKGLDKVIPRLVTALDKLEKLLSTTSKAYMVGTMLAAGPAMSKVVKDNDSNAYINLTAFDVAKQYKNVLGFVKAYKPLKRKSSKPNRFHDVTMASLDAWTKSRSGPEIPPFTSLLTAAGPCLGDGEGFIMMTGFWHGSTKLAKNNRYWKAKDNGYWASAGVCVIIVDVGPVPVPVPIPLVFPLSPSSGLAYAGYPTDKVHDIETYSGLQPYYGVAKIKKPDMESPTMSIFVAENSTTIHTTQNGNPPVGAGQFVLNDSEASAKMQVASSANAHFVRPDANLTLGGYTVYGNMFNPYWEAHLVPTPASMVTDYRKAQGGAP